MACTKPRWRAHLACSGNVEQVRSQNAVLEGQERLERGSEQGFAGSWLSNREKGVCFLCDQCKGPVQTHEPPGGGHPDMWTVEGQEVDQRMT